MFILQTQTNSIQHLDSRQQSKSLSLGMNDKFAINAGSEQRTYGFGSARPSATISVVGLCVCCPVGSYLQQRIVIHRG